MKDKHREFTHLLLLISAAVIWGAAFVAQSMGAEHVGPLAFLSIRSWLAFFVLLPVVVIAQKKRSAAREEQDESSKTRWRYAAIGGLVSGTFLFVASLFQQMGISQTTTAKAGFITALYVVFVPVISLFVGIRCTWRTWVSMALSVIGLYLLCMTGSGSFTWGDGLMLLCALVFGFQIISIGYFARKTDGVLLAEVQFFIEAVLATLFMCFFEHNTLEGIRGALPALLYTGVLSGAVGYTLQIVGQVGVKPAVASLAMSLESVFSAVFGWIILGQRMGAKEICGCLVMFSAIVLSQLSPKERVDDRKEAMEEG